MDEMDEAFWKTVIQTWFSGPPGSRYGPAAYFSMRADGFPSWEANEKKEHGTWPVKI